MAIKWQVYREQQTGLEIKSVWVIFENDQTGEYRLLEVSSVPVAQTIAEYAAQHGISIADAWSRAAVMATNEQQAEIARRRWLKSQLATKTPAEIHSYLTQQISAITTLAQAKTFLQTAIPMIAEIVAALIIQRED